MSFATPTTPNRADYLLFLRTHVGILAVDLPDSSNWIDTTLTIATEMVNLALNAANSVIYTLAVYNLGADRVINFAMDQPNRAYFTTLREKLTITAFAAGLVSSSSDSGTSQSLEVIEAAKRMTLGDLQLVKTPYGRQYLAFAQTYGPTVWGLT